MLDKDFNDILIDTFFPTFDWDRKNYKFNREEKDMHPHSIINRKDDTLITHNILGINKEDLRISTEKENGVTSLLIKGKTKDSITGKEYSIESRFNLNADELDLEKIKATAKNGLLYITIPNRKKELKKESKNIEIL